jgi:hypothetical protein
MPPIDGSDAGKLDQFSAVDVVFDILVWPTSMLGNGPPVMA